MTQTFESSLSLVLQRSAQEILHQEKGRNLLAEKRKIDFKTGKNIPILLPLAAIPVAKALRVVKYCGITAKLGSNRKPAPSPTVTACAIIKCQYCVHKLVIIIPSTAKKEPKATMLLKYPISKIGPDTPPISSRRKACRQPIQEILLSVLDERMCAS